MFGSNPKGEGHQATERTKRPSMVVKKKNSRTPGPTKGGEHPKEHTHSDNPTQQGNPHPSTSRQGGGQDPTGGGAVRRLRPDTRRSILHCCFVHSISHRHVSLNYGFAVRRGVSRVCWTRGCKYFWCE